MKRWSEITAQHFDDDSKYLLITSQDDGWEVYLDRTDSCFYLYNYRSMVKSQLPPVEDGEKMNRFSKCIVLSYRAPYYTPDVLTIMLIHDDFKTEIHCRCDDNDDDQQWHKGYLIKLEDWDNKFQVFSDVVAFNGKLYGVNAYFMVVEILISPGGDEATKLEQRFRIHCRMAKVWVETTRFVVSCNNLFLVVIHTANKFDAVFKLDVSRDRFLPIYDLGDQVFFIKGNYSISFPGRKVGHVGNCVYVTEQGNEFMYMLNLEDSTLSVQVHGGVTNKSFREGTLSFNRINNLLCSSSSSSGSTTTVTEREAGKVEDIEESLIMFKIPLHIQEQVAKFLNKGQDYCNFRSVCKSWRSMTPTRQWKIARNNEFLDCLWLMTIKRDTNGGTTCKLSDPKGIASYLMTTPDELSGCVIRYSKDGWLIVSNDFKEVFLYEPFAKKKIQLPNLPDIYPCGNGICFSHSPSSSSSSRLLVFCYNFLDSKSTWLEIAYLRLGDECWGYQNAWLHERFIPSYSSPVFSNGAFYFMSQAGDLGFFRINDSTWNIVTMSTPPVSLPPARKMVASFLISYNKDIYSVYVSNLAMQFVRVYKVAVDIFSADILSARRGKGEWEEVTSLRNKTFFLSKTSCSALVAPESSMRNKIYFPYFSLINNKNVFYCLETGKYHTFGGGDRDVTSNKGMCDTKEQLYSTWIRPSLIPISWSGIAGSPHNRDGRPILYCIPAPG